ncbi:hypothetical protein [Undibacterium oligocarboniphilum]|uniref:Uncharacterized protein n=1 Tax=Undibacterium oligocarboniphilum TaxID=666702 RepID=A0A850QRG5_9BURK|nr:hypothetical protein [Undibacterium oligocarboniphilum]MBC3871765.1 hypothetical protein [Undibacterium oligocarboniphilum]NVO79400.1 hypothetical protein [Undibacterium oligocarboniphilum]
MTAVADLFPETVNGVVPVRRFESTLCDPKWGNPRALAELRPQWNASSGEWVIGWFCFVEKASADEWLHGQNTPQSWPWYRPGSQPNGKELDVALAVAARALKIVLTQIKEYAQPEAAKAADELIERLETEARKWLGAIN